MIDALLAALLCFFDRYYYVLLHSNYSLSYKVDYIHFKMDGRMDASYLIQIGLNPAGLHIYRDSRSPGVECKHA